MESCVSHGRCWIDWRLHRRCLTFVDWTRRSAVTANWRGHDSCTTRSGEWFVPRRHPRFASVHDWDTVMFSVPCWNCLLVSVVWSFSLQKFPWTFFGSLESGTWNGSCLGACADVVPDMSHCQITRSTRFARRVGIIKPNPKTLTLIITLTEEINIK